MRAQKNRRLPGRRRVSGRIAGHASFLMPNNLRSNPRSTRGLLTTTICITHASLSAAGNGDAHEHQQNGQHRYHALRREEPGYQQADAEGRGQTALGILPEPHVITAPCDSLYCHYMRSGGKGVCPPPLSRNKR